MVSTIVTIISGCIVSVFTYWLHTRNNKKNRRFVTSTIKPPYYGNSKGVWCIYNRNYCYVYYSSVHHTYQ
ncbi:type I toxin-antitoxin system Fst family toxin [Staphylococcus warneri]|uniref:type I toxin-antitoxin system Fst family toxin n=1 Tax=Staphylococcus warneri TaxID=1292 RepID=UPI003CF8D737